MVHDKVVDQVSGSKSPAVPCIHHDQHGLAVEQSYGLEQSTAYVHGWV